MRVMVKNDNHKIKLKVAFCAVLCNGWEYFLEKPNKDGVAFGLVCGYEDELGDVYLPEIKPHIISTADEHISNAFPAPGWHWVDEVANI